MTTLHFRHFTSTELFEPSWCQQWRFCVVTEQHAMVRQAIVSCCNLTLHSQICPRLHMLDRSPVLKTFTCPYWLSIIATPGNNRKSALCDKDYQICMKFTGRGLCITSSNMTFNYCVFSRTTVMWYKACNTSFPAPHTPQRNCQNHCRGLKKSWKCTAALTSILPEPQCMGWFKGSFIKNNILGEFHDLRSVIHVTLITEQCNNLHSMNNLCTSRSFLPQGCTNLDSV